MDIAIRQFLAYLGCSEYSFGKILCEESLRHLVSQLLRSRSLNDYVSAGFKTIISEMKNPNPGWKKPHPVCNHTFTLKKNTQNPAANENWTVGGRGIKAKYEIMGEKTSF
jgi:hypothetical protein